jgi:hypothetical protein
MNEDYKFILGVLLLSIVLILGGMGLSMLRQPDTDYLDLISKLQNRVSHLEKKIIKEDVK